MACGEVNPNVVLQVLRLLRFYLTYCIYLPLQVRYVYSAPNVTGANACYC